MSVGMARLDGFNKLFLEQSIAMIAGTSWVSVTDIRLGVSTELELGGVAETAFGPPETLALIALVEQQLGE